LEILEQKTEFFNLDAKKDLNIWTYENLKIWRYEVVIDVPLSLLGILALWCDVKSTKIGKWWILDEPQGQDAQMKRSNPDNVKIWS
jgi:hypothetical protein